MVSVRQFATPEEVVEQAARLVIAAVRARPNLVLGLATGETMRPLHAALVRDVRENGTSWRGVTAFNLDDYVGVPAAHPASFRRFMQETLFDHIDISPDRCHMPDGMAADLEREAAAYEARIEAAGGIDLQLLGLGRNGHIAFNEPGSDFASRTRPVTLASTTREAAGGSFAGGEQVPMRGLTMGIASILDARRILLIACGRGKARAVADALAAPARPERPASALQGHPDTTFLIDREAAAELSAPG